MDGDAPATRDVDAVTRAGFTRIAAYTVCVDADDRLLLCRLSQAVADRQGWWTLPGGGLDFGEHPEQAAVRELREETGLEGQLTDLLAVDSITRELRDGTGGAARPYHSVRIVYRAEIVGGALRHEVGGSSDLAAWMTRDELAAQRLVELAHLGLRLAFGGGTGP